MSPKPGLVYAVMVLLVTYIALTAIWLVPDWNAVHAPQALAIARHFGVVLLIVGVLYFQPQMGCWLALAWCAVAPFDFYSMVVHEITRVISGAPRTLAGADIFRVLLLLTAGLLSGTLALQLQRRRSEGATAGAAGER